MFKYFHLKKQIQKLQKEAEIVRKRERAETIAKIREAIVAFELTAKDLGFSVTKRRRHVQNLGEKTEELGAAAVAKRRGRPPKPVSAPRASRKGGRKAASADKRRVVVPKYRDSATGATWTGRGKQPKWLAAAIKGGRKLEDFKI